MNSKKKKNFFLEIIVVNGDLINYKGTMRSILDGVQGGVFAFYFLSNYVSFYV